MTPVEKILWGKLRAKRFHGVKFRRQVPLGPFIVDFFCAERFLVIEIDGDSHFEPGAKEKDSRRDAYLHEHGFQMLRFGNRQMIDALEYVLESIAAAVA